MPAPLDSYSSKNAPAASLGAPVFAGPSPLAVPDLAASFQASVVDVLSRKAADATTREGARSLLLSGGVAANGALRAALVERSPVPVFAPPPVLCTDNGAMIAACAYYRFDALRAGWDLDPQPSMPFC